MNMDHVITFDLSSSLIGITYGIVEDRKVTSVRTEGIVPRKPNGKDYGYTTLKPKKIGRGYPAFLLPGEHHISKAEADRRNKFIKHDAHRQLLLNIGEDIGERVESFGPSKLFIERNESFNGVLTTKLLAEIAGGLFFYSGLARVPFEDFNAATVRKTVRDTIPLSRQERVLKDGTLALETKLEIKERLRKVYGHMMDFDDMTTDESDSLALFHHVVVREGWEVIT